MSEMSKKENIVALADAIRDKVIDDIMQSEIGKYLYTRYTKHNRIYLVINNGKAFTSIMYFGGKTPFTMYIDGVPTHYFRSRESLFVFLKNNIKELQK